MGVDELFDEFDVDKGGSISFRELNRLLRRDVKAEARTRTKTTEALVEIADVHALRRTVRQSMLGFSNVEVALVEDPLTGKLVDRFIKLKL